MGDLSQNFSSREFEDRRTGDHPLPSPALLVVLERIRGLTGRPLSIVSGYRSLATNSQLPTAARDSRHTYGDAADIPPGHATEAQARAAGARGIGVKDGWAIHVDVRPGGAARWEY